MGRTTIIFTLLLISFTDAERILRTIKVGGVGTASSAPDQATISNDVTTFSKTAEEALSTNKVSVDRIVAVMKEIGIGEKDINTILFKVEPEFEQRDGEKSAIGYKVSKRLEVKVRNMDILGDILDALDSAGGAMKEIKVGVANMEGLLKTSRRRAMNDARKRGRVYLKAVGLRIGDVISITESVDKRLNEVCSGHLRRWENANGQVNVTSCVVVVFAVGDLVPVPGNGTN